MKRVTDLGEDRLIETLLRNAPVATGLAGPGDDCAVVELAGSKLQLLKTDAMVEGIHWLPQTDARRVGWKAVARVISDFAAMGGTPADFLITVALPAATPLEWATELYAGIGKCLETHGGRIAGGETTRTPDGGPVFLSIAATGEVSRDQLTLRSGGKPGDALLVTGRLGGSLSGKHLDFQPRLRQAAWLTRHFKPAAMMDLSDGLAKDLPRLALASHCGYRLDPASIPCTDGCGMDQALADGEDYELLLAIDPKQASALLEAWPREFSDLALSCIGQLCPPGEGDSLEGGWDHFGPHDR